jgi:2-polyprenyl-3-methyl-5-hydroxy-6-metoxy-1,4-benzoquinol methylase
VTTLHNRTRTSDSIPRKLLRQGKVHLLPIYALMRTSDLAREGIENSGSYRFADHVYRNEPSGRFGIGRALDAVLLRMRGARSMRNRFLHAQREIRAAARALDSRAATDPVATTAPFRVLSVPCGIARDLVLAARSVERELPRVYSRSTFFGVDLDQAPLELSRSLAGPDDHYFFTRGDALDAKSYPSELDVIVSTGLGEFLSDELLVRFYTNCHERLRVGGTLVTSAMQRDRIADYLMRQLAELHTHYRRGDEIIRWLHTAGFHEVSVRQDDVGLQTLVVARRTERRRSDSGSGGAP